MELDEGSQDPQRSTWAAGVRFSAAVGLVAAGVAGVLLTGPSLRPGDSGWVLSLADWNEVLPLAAKFFVAGAGVAGISYVLSNRSRRRRPRAAPESWLEAGERVLAQGACGPVRGAWFDHGWLYLTDRRLRGVRTVRWVGDDLECAWPLTDVAEVAGAEGSELFARLGLVSGHVELRLTSGEAVRISGVSSTFWLDRIQDARAAAIEAEASRVELERTKDAEADPAQTVPAPPDRAGSADDGVA